MNAPQTLAAWFEHRAPKKLLVATATLNCAIQALLAKKTPAYEGR